MLGGYSGRPLHESTVLQGIRDRAPDGRRDRPPRGLPRDDWRILAAGRGDAGDPAENRTLIKEAAALAATADVVVLAIGDNEQTSREAWAFNHLGDRASLDLAGQQDELVDAIAATGKPIVALVFSGRPASIRNVAEKAAAILELWYLGQESGRAVADALFGDINPGGKLPITLPRSVGHVPAFYNYKPSARRGYVFDSTAPLFAFGYGLSYTTFSFENLRLERNDIGTGDSTRVSVDVTNTGHARRRRSGAALHPRRHQQRDAPGQGTEGLPAHHARSPARRRTVTFDITPDSLAFYDIDMKWTRRTRRVQADGGLLVSRRGPADDRPARAVGTAD